MRRDHSSRTGCQRSGVRLAAALAAALGTFACLHAQTGSVVELRSADELQVHMLNGEEVRELIGNVHFIQLSSEGDSVFVWTDRAMRYMARDVIELFGHVRIVRGGATLRSSMGVYSAKERKADMPDGVRLEREGVTLTARQGTYWVDDERAHVRGNVVLVDSVSRTTSDAMTYFEAQERAIAVGHVRVVSLEDNVTILGDSLIHFRKQGISIVPVHPTLLQIDSTADGEGDTLVVVSERMESYRDTSERFIAIGDVRIVRGDLAARCARSELDRSNNVMLFQGDPVVWEGENQMTGDSIAAFLVGNELRRLHVIGRAMAVSRSDSVFRDRFNQLTGQEITLRFVERKLEQIEVLTNATSLYYLYEESSPNGVNRSSGDRIRIDFAQGRIDQITVVGGVEGTYSPESLVHSRETEFNLDGFRWLSDRPSRNLPITALKSYD